MTGPGPSYWLQGRIHRAGRPSRHCGLDPQSREAMAGRPSYWLQGSIHRAAGDCLIFTLTFDSSPIKEEGSMSVGLACCLPAPALPLWIADQVRNDVTMRCIVFTLTLALSHQGRRGFGWLCCLVVCPPRHHPSRLRIKSAMT